MWIEKKTITSPAFSEIICRALPLGSTLYIWDPSSDITQDVRNQGVQGVVLFGDIRAVEGTEFTQADTKDEGGGSGGYL